MENAFSSPFPSSPSTTNEEGKEEQCADNKPFVDVPGAVEAWKGEGGYLTYVRGCRCVLCLSTVFGNGHTYSFCFRAWVGRSAAAATAIMT